MQNSTISSSLFERIGGMPAVNAAVDIFYSKVIADNSVNYFFRHIDMKKQMPKLKTFLAYAFGAPIQYAGKNMRAAHAHMKISEDQFSAVAGHLVETLNELNVASTLVEEVVQIALSVKDDIVTA